MPFLLLTSAKDIHWTTSFLQPLTVRSPLYLLSEVNTLHLLLMTSLPILIIFAVF